MYKVLTFDSVHEIVSVPGFLVETLKHQLDALRPTIFTVRRVLPLSLK